MRACAAAALTCALQSAAVPGKASCAVAGEASARRCHVHTCAVHCIAHAAARVPIASIEVCRNTANNPQQPFSTVPDLYQKPFAIVKPAAYARAVTTLEHA